MYYIVKFTESNSIGTIKKEWMLDETKCVYPASKNIKKYLSMKEGPSDKGKWKIYKCSLKYPKWMTEAGFEKLEDAIAKEKFYVENSDTDEYETKQNFKKYHHLHPLAKYDDNMDLNHLIAEENVNNISFLTLGT
jgi:hypothetical protein